MSAEANGIGFEHRVVITTVSNLSELGEATEIERNCSREERKAYGN